jgi:hypothetical protein
MSDKGHQLWEVGGGGSPPSLLVEMMEPGESLLWAVRFKSNRFDTKRAWLFFIILLLTVLFLYLAPWGESISEYCGSGADRSCPRIYFFAWPLVACGTFLSVGIAHTHWKSKSSPWWISYGISTKRALQIDERRPKAIRSANLDRTAARISFLGSVRVGKSKSAMVFPGLDNSVARRAVYWVNEGRFRIDNPTGTTAN